MEFLHPRPAEHCHLEELIVLSEGEAVENVDMGQFLIELDTFLKKFEHLFLKDPFHLAAYTLT